MVPSAPGWDEHEDGAARFCYFEALDESFVRGMSGSIENALFNGVGELLGALASVKRRGRRWRLRYLTSWCGDRRDVLVGRWRTLVALLQNSTYDSTMWDWIDD